MKSAKAISAEVERMRRLQAAREAKREWTTWNRVQGLPDRLDGRGFGLASFPKLGVESGAALLCAFPSLHRVRELVRIVGAVSKVAGSKQGALYERDLRRPHTLGRDESAPLLNIIGQRAFSDACLSSHSSIREEFPHSQFHPYFDVLSDVLQAIPLPRESLKRARMRVEECALMNEIVFQTRNAIEGLCRSEHGVSAALPYSTSSLDPDRYTRLRERVRKNRKDISDFLHRTCADSQAVRVICFVASHAATSHQAPSTGESTSLQIPCSMQGLWIRSAELLEALRTWCAQKCIGQPIAAIRKFEHCKTGGLRMLIAFFMPGGSQQGEAIFRTLVPAMWTSANPEIWQISTHAPGLDLLPGSEPLKFSEACSKVMARLVEIDTLVCFDPQTVGVSCRELAGVKMLSKRLVN